MDKFSENELLNMVMDVVDDIGDHYATLENMRQVKPYIKDKEQYDVREMEIKNEIHELEHRFNHLMILIQANSNTKTMRLNEENELDI